ncbi:hypothetical protein FSP39_016691 [Pinctada imbricata]|uniref:Beclin 1-associated autophagy-related key regulator n=1 Tax=Pinctada imbricata TaxID=66713 RepID=A0AA88XX68_PINIB|nr:hypothetical protein FSP39_016691 [Pinctada imbricata]
MAASSSCESNLAPTEFDVSSSSGSSSGLSVAVERCPLCDCSKKPFFCRTCINNGLFVHSKGSFPVRFTDKQHQLEWLEKEKHVVLQRYMYINMLYNINNFSQRAELDLCKEKIKLLKHAIVEARNNVVRAKHSLEKSRKDNYTRSMKARKHAEKKQKIQEYIQTTKKAIQLKEDVLRSTTENLAQERREQINILTQLIFPVEEVKLCSESDMAVSTVSALREASHTAYVRGHWVYTDGSGEAQYRIVEPTLPCSGDYSAYHLWVAANHESGVNPDNSLCNPGHRISAGLCYSSQLMSILSHILDVRLPRKQPYSEFCINELAEKPFNDCVARLNQNVLYLCFSQGICDREELDPRNTLQNLAVLITNEAVGRNCSFEINQDLMESIEGSVILQEEDSDATTADESPDLAGEWEEVHDEFSDNYDTIVPSRGAGYSSALASIQTMSYPNAPSETSQLTASGFVTSAASSLMSLFRGGDKR